MRLASEGAHDPAWPKFCYGGPVPRTYALWIALSGFAQVLAVGCDDLADFRGNFDGSIVKGNFVRSCFAEETRAKLHFNAAYATGDVSVLPESERNWLSTTDGTFDRTVLEPISKLEDDQLSLFTFPGPKRLKNYLLLARPKEGPLAQRDALIVVSLLDEENIELRVIGRTSDTSQACAVEADAGESVDPDAGTQPAGMASGAREYFGFFRLKSE